ncbi:FecR family protein [Pedobacter hiemivivus]|uniref:FecR family protein n=1 Tax=Pedobacter hiemivivus TaxID=2530454 RepID=A0A4R0NHD1_9SPHI|nr:FecR domain-containing protein [Pedobacter hiemivivus]TCC98722.1 FecR family protein [Pedobacter hiemivivus]
MNQNRINHLHDRYIAGKLNAGESVEWQQFVNDPDSEEQILLLIEDSWKKIPVDLLDDLEPVRSDELLNRIVKEPQLRKMHRKLWLRISGAAAILLLATAAVFWFISTKKLQSAVAFKTDIHAGKIGATLTLADGRQIKLDNAENGNLAEDAGVKISKTKAGELIYEVNENQHSANKMNTLSTSRGETYQVRLPDGSQIWLNAASSLTYTANLKQAGKRKVYLDGEAYFEVAKDKLAPFIVETNNQTVEVLGTHFNINSYLNERSSNTTLLEGSVKISTKSGVNEILNPGEQGVITSGKLSIEAVDSRFSIAWKNNKFMFESASIQEVMRMIERWYNVEVIYEGEIPENKFGGSVSRFDNVSKVLQILASTKKVNFRIEERRIYVTK